MASPLRLSPPALLSTSRPCLLPEKTPFLHPVDRNPPRKYHQRVQISKFGSFLDLEPKSKPEPLDFDVPWFDPADRRRFDVIVIGAGPAGLRLAKQVSGHGDQANGVKFHKAKVWKVEHEEFESSIACDDGTELKASLIVDASGFRSSFIEYDKPRNNGYQIAHGILAEVDQHPFDLDKMVLMDWRDSHLGNEPYLRASNSRLPTFLYVMPFDSNLVFLEETSLVSRPVLSYTEVKQRMVARLRQLGIRVRTVIEDEKCLIPMGGPLPRIPQSVMAIGGNSGIVHPSTGYTVAQTMAVAPVVAEAIAECLGSTRMIRGSQLYHRMWNALWPVERRWCREYYNFGMETLLKLDLNGTRRFFDAFFELNPHLWQGFLSARLSYGELVTLGICLFGRSSNPSKLDLVTKCPAPLVKMVGNMALEAI